MASEQSKIAVMQTSQSTATAEILKESSVEIQLVPDLKVLSDEISAAVAGQKADADFELFGDDDSEEDEDKERLVQERLKAYAEKKAKKPGVIAKSTVIYDVKPWDDTIDVKQIEEKVRAIEKDGLVWGTSKVVPVAYELNKLQICCVIEDEKVSTDWLEEEITANEDLVQSVDMVAFNKSIVIPHSYTIYEAVTGRKPDGWLLADSGYDHAIKGRIFIFGRKSYEQWIGMVKKIYADETFKISLPLFEQMIPQQSNSYDCGICNCLFAQSVSRDVLPDFKQQQVKEICRRILKEPLTESCLNQRKLMNLL
uniref:Ubiquitin-like protease family profile domain-containing protein n=1 Tax=Ditylenchus dipsaci TaxID=166011 RepID=A0A915EI49_9BILA